VGFNMPCTSSFALMPGDTARSLRSIFRDSIQKAIEPDF
jgi:hypothetical protein